ncbi:hypothetical protein AB0F17_60920 [Nonomuraea sp. NPDC026600]
MPWIDEGPVWPRAPPRRPIPPTLLLAFTVGVGVGQLVLSPT